MKKFALVLSIVQLFSLAAFGAESYQCTASDETRGQTVTANFEVAQPTASNQTAFAWAFGGTNKRHSVQLLLTVGSAILKVMDVRGNWIGQSAVSVSSLPAIFSVEYSFKKTTITANCALQ